MMNFREGFRRLYILFGAIALMAGAASIVKDLPDEDSIHWRYLPRLREDIAPQIASETWRVDLGTMSTGEYIANYCNGTLVYGQGADQKEIKPSKFYCTSITNEIAELPKKRMEALLYGVGYLLAGLAGLIGFYVIVRWIVNGFFPKRQAG
jgi:hypothetical protein